MADANTDRSNQRASVLLEVHDYLRSLMGYSYPHMRQETDEITGYKFQAQKIFFNSKMKDLETEQWRQSSTRAASNDNPDELRLVRAQRDARKKVAAIVAPMLKDALDEIRSIGRKRSDMADVESKMVELLRYANIVRNGECVWRYHLDGSLTPGVPYGGGE